MACVAAAAPAKPDTKRKGFDYRRPEPGEILSNPTTGVGSPPRLEEFSPTGTMGDTAPAAPAEPLSPATSTAAPEPLAPAPTFAPPTAPAPVSKPASDTSHIPLEASPAPVIAAPASHEPDLQAALAAEIDRVGIDGISTTLPPSTIVGDAALRSAAEHAWTALTRGLAAARSTWDQRFPERTRAAQERFQATIAPGRLTIVAAPARVTGAFDPPP